MLAVGKLGWMGLGVDGVGVWGGWGLGWMGFEVDGVWGGWGWGWRDSLESA